ncbi:MULTISPECIES: hypothetical protein [unclassified Mesorhizobium]|uniref:hypothetical protein n=1 Tax=unclassified Mesorhizobium TaxID=325217 RepID=UPI000FD965C2|nr:MULTISPECIES: hypothetical protein [unclassified Mesorhizobium]TGQ48084.1 hypothetical protein EN859_002675 [Mesorhizobium sp. M00.F.Ca.ET.216.01.1.1]TIS54625.1 MAG: hypothetical protein E5W91_26060 [Mesorhizobium sp.]TIS90169.1 MAG: hypothetical protein E5W89_12190 [Mesorhizobium sp.]TJW17637.1 MAG: hypothetical protein E5W82_01180 [Mesorhizobium sp.]TJW48337.1 MAG: hypothetical protein E5W83_03625 [Mesorhizobium sp.]
MQKIVLTVATLLFASGMAFAGSDHYGSTYNHGSYSNAGHGYSMAKVSATSDASYSVDLNATNSVSTADGAPAVGGTSNFDIPAAGQGIWGR